MYYEIGIEYEFEAGHYLTGLPDTHKCSRLHGHNYVVVVELRSKELNKVGFVVDYFDIRPIKEYIDSQWDHRLLNEVVSFNTTVENLAAFLYREFKPRFPQLHAITIKETPSTYARFTEAPG